MFYDNYTLNDKSNVSFILVSVKRFTKHWYKLQISKKKIFLINGNISGHIHFYILEIGSLNAGEKLDQLKKKKKLQILKTLRIM